MTVQEGNYLLMVHGNYLMIPDSKQCQQDVTLAHSWQLVRVPLLVRVPQGGGLSMHTLKLCSGIRSGITREIYKVLSY